MGKETSTMCKRGTRDFQRILKGKDPLRYRRVSSIKSHADDSIERLKAHLVAKGYIKPMVLIILRPSLLLLNSIWYAFLFLLLFSLIGHYFN